MVSLFPPLMDAVYPGPRTLDALVEKRAGENGPLRPQLESLRDGSRTWRDAIPLPPQANLPILRSPRKEGRTSGTLHRSNARWMGCWTTQSGRERHRETPGCLGSTCTNRSVARGSFWRSPVSASTGNSSIPLAVHSSRYARSSTASWTSFSRRTPTRSTRSCGRTLR